MNRISAHPLWQLTAARLRMFFREPGAVFWAFGFPVLLTVALGVAFRNRPPEPVQAAVQAGEGAARVLAVLQASPDVRVSLLDADDAHAALRSGRVSLVVVPGASRTYEYDPTRPESRLARALVDDVLQRADGRADPVPVVDRALSEPGARYIDFLVPGLIGMNIMSSGMWGIGYMIVDMRTRKLLKRMLATPMKRGHFLLSFVVMRLLFLVFELPVLLLFPFLAFGVEVRGSLVLLSGVAVLGAFAFAGIGLLVASRAENTQTASGLMNLVMMPMFVCSGVFFSASNFPDAVQPLIRVLPLTALNDALRAIMSEGAGPSAIAGPVLLLGVVSLATFGAALRLFRWS